MSKMSLFTLVFTSALAIIQTASAEIQFSGSTEFGLSPSNQEKPKKKSVLPDCDDPYYAKEAKAGYCLGPVLPEKIAGITLDDEWIHEDYLVRILKRNPELVGLSKFLSICRSKNGLISTDKLRCEYTIWF